MLNELFTKRVVNKAFIKVLCDEMDYFDARFTDYIVNDLVAQNLNLKNANFDNAKFDFVYANELIDEYKYRVSISALEAYGWAPNNVKKAIIKNLPEEYKAPLQKQSNNEGEM